MIPNPSPISAAVLAACPLPAADRQRTDEANARLARAESIIQALAKIDVDVLQADESVTSGELAHADALKVRALGDDPGAQPIKKLRDAVLNARTHREGLDLARSALLGDLAGIEAAIAADAESDLGGIPAQHAQRLWLALQPEIEAAARALLPLAVRVEAQHAVTPCRDKADWLNSLCVPGFTFKAAPVLDRATARIETDLLAAGVKAIRGAGAGEPEAVLAAVRSYTPAARRGPPAPAKGTGYGSDNSKTRAAEATRAAAAGTPVAAPAMPSATPKSSAPEIDMNRQAAMRSTGHHEPVSEFAPRMLARLTPPPGGEFTPWATGL